MYQKRRKNANMLESWELKIGDVIVTGYKATHVMFRV